MRGARLRGSILQRAAELASIDGLDQVSIARLAAEMGMSKSGLYAYFTSKQDLQLATIDCAWSVFEEHVLEPGDDALGALLERWISYYEREVFPGGCLFITAGTEFANRDGPVREALARAIERQVGALEHAIAAGDGAATGATPASSPSSCTPCSPPATSASASAATRRRLSTRAPRCGGC